MESAVTPDSPRWPQQLAEWVEQLAPGTACAPGSASPVRERAWLLLLGALRQFLRLHARRLGGVADDDLDDLAAEKSLDLLLRAERGDWSLSRRRPGEIVNYLSTVARNGLFDHLREQGRYADVEVGGEGEGHVEPVAPETSAPDRAVENREFAAHLRACFEALDARSRYVWFLRVFLDLASRDIADHPRVGLERGHVDVILQRARGAVRGCMETKGHVAHDPPPGAFVEVYRSMRNLETP